METQVIAIETPILDEQAMSQAARAAAGVLGIDGQVETTGDWPTDRGDAHVMTSFRGAVGGNLHLIADDETVQRLLGDASTAPALLGAVLESLGVSTDDIDVDAFKVAAEQPDKIAMIVRPDVAPIWIGLTMATESAPKEFEPAPVKAAAGDGPGRTGAMMGSLAMLSEVEMNVTVELGRTKMPIRELLALQPGMVVEIDRAAGAPIDVLVNGRLIACGEVVVIDEEFGVRITEITSNETNA